MTVTGELHELRLEAIHVPDNIRETSDPDKDAELRESIRARGVRQPILADLRDSGGIEQTADIVLLLHRPSFYEPAQKPGIAEVEIAKQRNGPREIIELQFDSQHARFRDLETRREAPWQQMKTSMTASA